jgi:hypothetical protein
MRIRDCETGIEGILKPTKDNTAHGLDVEYTVVEGPHAKRKFYGYPLVKGTTEGQLKAVDITMRLLRAILDSAFYLDPNDESPEASSKRHVNFRDFDGIRFLAEIGIERSRDSAYPDKNVLLRAITRDLPLWGGRPPIEQSPAVRASQPPTSASVNATTTAPVPIEKPKWAD